MLSLAGLSWDLVQAGSIERCWLLGLSTTFEPRLVQEGGRLMDQAEAVMEHGKMLTELTHLAALAYKRLEPMGVAEWLYLDNGNVGPGRPVLVIDPELGVKKYAPNQGRASVPMPTTGEAMQSLETVLQWLESQDPQTVGPLKLIQLCLLISVAQRLGGITPAQGE